MELIRSMWSCGEADWLTTVAGVTDLKTTVGYPLRFGARDVVALLAAGVSADQAASAPPSSVEDLIACHRPSCA